MTHDSFLKLIFLTIPYLNYIRNKSRVRNIIILEIMVPITIRYLAGGIILDLKNVYGANRSWCYELRDKVIIAIFKCSILDISFPIDKYDEMNEIRLGFTSKSELNIFYHAVGALRDMLQACECPTKEDSNGNQNGYYFGHYQTISLNCQGMLYTLLWFTFFAVAAPGKESDICALNRTNFSPILESIPPFGYVVCDAAYALSNKMSIPFTGSQRNIPENDAFNFY